MQPAPKSIETLDELITRPNDKVVEALRQIDGRISVLGAGGKMGFHLCQMIQRALINLGRKDRVCAVSRFGSVETKRNFEQAGFDVIAADLLDDQQLQALPNAENVFYLAGVKFGTSGNPALLERFNVEMPRKVATRFQDSRIVALSTGCVYSFTTPESGGSKEEDPTDPVGDYAVSCMGREKEFEAASNRFGTQSALIRLNYAIDLRYGVLVDVAARVLNEQPVNVSTGYANVIWHGDAIAQIIQSLPLTDNPPLVLNVTGTDVLSVRDVANQFGRLFSKEVHIEGEESPTAWLSNAARSHQLFGTPEVSVDKMMAWVADWLKNNRPLLNKPTHFEVRDGNY